MLVPYRTAPHPAPWFVTTPPPSHHTPGDSRWAVPAGLPRQNVGAESLTIEFPLTPYLGSGKEAGWNGLYFWSTTHCWVRDVSIINADLGIALDGTYFCTVQDVQLGSGPRGPDNGLWGIWLKNGADVLLRNVQFATRFLRDIAVQGAQVGTVVSNCE